MATVIRAIMLKTTHLLQKRLTITMGRSNHKLQLAVLILRFRLRTSRRSLGK